MAGRRENGLRLWGGGAATDCKRKKVYGYLVNPVSSPIAKTISISPTEKEKMALPHEQKGERETPLNILF